MHFLITNILEYSSIDKQEVQFSILDANEIVNEILKNLDLTIIKANANIKVEKLPHINGNVSQINRLFFSLIDNAIKFRKKDIPLEISISAEDKGHYSLFSIKDNGIGIDEKYKDKVFYIFQRLEDRAEYPGTGIGLSIAKKIVEFHKGKIWFNSIPGDGTTFYFTIPAITQG